MMEEPPMTAFNPYCGSPPLPGQVAWNSDPVLAACLAAILAIAWRFLLPARQSRSDAACLLAGWALLALALMSPLCNLSVALFSARAAQHLAIALIAAPLIALSGAPSRLFQLFAASRAKSAAGGLLNPAVVIFAAVYWFWHFAYPYDLALQNNAVYWTMQATIIIASIALWSAILGKGDLRFVAGSVFTGLQMAMLGALLTLSGAPWFRAHSTTTAPWGMTPLEDQQMGGALMWTVGGILLAGFLLYGFARCFAALASQANPPESWVASER
jgi:putative membrane protein